MGNFGVYITLYMINIMFSLFSWCILSCTVPLPRAIRSPDLPFKMVFCISVGWCIKASMYGVTQLDAPESIMACDVSFVYAFVAISTAILSSCCFVSLIDFAMVSHRCRQMPHHVDIDVECWVV
jgi:hypothetical protein